MGRTYGKYQQEYRRRHPLRCREWQRWAEIKRIYGLTKKEYLSIFCLQLGLCKICGRVVKVPGTWPDRQLIAQVDHNHETGKVRGLLCHQCNKGLGCFLDSATIIRRAAAYLDRH